MPIVVGSRVRVTVQPSPNPGARPAVYGREGVVLAMTERGGRWYAVVTFHACLLKLYTGAAVFLGADEEEVFVAYLEAF